MTRAAVILAGGAGTRLRPLSSDENPKQFLNLFDGESLLQRSWQRLTTVVEPEAIFVSTNVAYAARCREQLPDLRDDNILAEPARKNTAPAIALSTFTIESRIGIVTVAFVPSDHFIGDVPEFSRVLHRAFDFAETHSELVTIGIAPTHPDTGFGYLELGEEIEPGIARVRSFTEKPSRERAEALLAAGNHAWNGGMFVWRTDVFRRALEKSAPDVARVTAANYTTMPSISIDYALMEKTPNVVAIAGAFDWSDVGSFEALEKLGVKLPG